MEAKRGFRAYELDVTVRQARDGPGPVLDTPGAVAGHFSDLASRDREVFVVACVDTRKRLVAWEEAFIGTIDSVVVHPREILRAALLTMAAGFFIIHNHPSGLPDPSEEDLAFTRRLADAGELLSIPLLDSVIIGSHGRYCGVRGCPPLSPDRNGSGWESNPPGAACTTPQRF